MYDYMELAIGMVSSTYFGINGKGIRSYFDRLSDDVISAAWHAGIGVHALIWVNAIIPILIVNKADRFNGLVRIRRRQ